MTPNESDAIIKYVEFQIEHILRATEKSIDPDLLPELFAMGHDMLTDLRRTFDVQIEIDDATKLDGQLKNLKK